MNRSELQWLGRLQLAESVREALIQDICLHSSRPFILEPTVRMIAGRARGGLTAIIFNGCVNTQVDPNGSFYGYALKIPHSRFEPVASLRASEFGLGPRVIWADQRLIIEEYLPPEWQARNSVLVGEQLAPRFAEKFLTMVRNNLFHAFDDLPTHLYIATTEFKIGEPRFIDWGRAQCLPSSKRDQDRFLTSKLRTLCQLVADYAGYTTGYKVFRELLTHSKGISHDLGRVLLDAERELVSNSLSTWRETLFAERWSKFFQACAD